MRGDGILYKWRETRENLVREGKYNEAKQLTPDDINLIDSGDLVAKKLIKFVQATSTLPLPTEISEEEKRKQTTFNLLNNTVAGKGFVRVECFVEKDKELTSTTFSTSTTMSTSSPANYCCSGPEHCVLKKIADPKKHVCAICNGAVHTICGVPNPEFEKNLVGFRYSTICMTCHSKGAQSKGARSTQHTESTRSEIGVAFKRPDGKWSVSIGIQEPFVIKQEDLMDQEKYFVTHVGSSLTMEQATEQARKLKRHRKREVAKKK